MVNIHSINLTERNEQIYRIHFGRKGRAGLFSRWINRVMNDEFNLNPVEALNKEIDVLKEDLIKLVEKRNRLIEDK